MTLEVSKTLVYFGLLLKRISVNELVDFLKSRKSIKELVCSCSLSNRFEKFFPKELMICFPCSTGVLILTFWDLVSIKFWKLSLALFFNCWGVKWCWWLKWGERSLRGVLDFWVFKLNVFYGEDSIICVSGTKLCFFTINSCNWCFSKN